MNTAQKIHIIAVAYERFGELKVFVQSILNQTDKNWHLTVYHDGPNEIFCDIMSNFFAESPDQIEYIATEHRYNDYGHSLREIGLQNIKEQYVMLTNADNYLIPKAIEYLNRTIIQTNADVIMYDMVHSHNRPGNRALPPYSFFETFYERGSIDIGAAIVKRDLAEKVGFRDKTHDGDATYFEDVFAERKPSGLSVAKIPQILFVHN